MIIYKIPLTTAEEIGKRLDSIHYKSSTCSNLQVGKNLLSSGKDWGHQEIYLVLSDDNRFINWQYEIYGRPFEEITLDTTYYGSI